MKRIHKLVIIESIIFIALFELFQKLVEMWDIPVPANEAILVTSAAIFLAGIAGYIFWVIENHLEEEKANSRHDAWVDAYDALQFHTPKKEKKGEQNG
jgi:hypothetical protein